MQGKKSRNERHSRCTQRSPPAPRAPPPRVRAPCPHMRRWCALSHLEGVARQDRQTRSREKNQAQEPHAAALEPPNPCNHFLRRAPPDDSPRLAPPRRPKKIKNIFFPEGEARGQGEPPTSRVSGSGYDGRGERVPVCAGRALVFLGVHVSFPPGKPTRPPRPSTHPRGCAGKVPARAAAVRGGRGGRVVCTSSDVRSDFFSRGSGDDTQWDF